MSKEEKKEPPFSEEESSEEKPAEIIGFPIEEKNLEKVTPDLTRPVTITLRSSLIEAIEQVADSKGKNRSQVISEAIEEFLKKGSNSLFAEISDRLSHIEEAVLGKKEVTPIQESLPIVDRTEEIMELFREFAGSLWAELGDFLEQVKAKNLTGAVWNEALLTQYAVILKEYSDEAWDTSLEKLLAVSVEAMGLSDLQAAFLRDKLGLKASEPIESEEEE